MTSDPATRGPRLAAPRWRVYREIMKLVDNAFSPFALTTPCSTPTRDRGTRDDMRRRTLAALLTLLFLGIGCPAPAARCGRACCLRACRPAVDRCVALSTLSRHTCRRTLLRECKSGGPPACDGPYPPAPIPPPVATSRLEYVFPDGSFSVYDMDNGHQLVKSVALPQARGIRGVIAHAATHALYISYGGDGDGQHGAPTMLKYDLLTDTVVWTHAYPIGIDSISISPDGSRLYLPTGELASGGTWYVINASSGDVVGRIDGPAGPHNTIVSLDGAHVYLGGRANNYLAVADTSTDQVFRRIGPLQSSVRPFTIDGRETVAYITITGLRGFQVGDISNGTVLRTVTFTGPNSPGAEPPTEGGTACDGALVDSWEIPRSQHNGPVGERQSVFQ